MRDARGMTEDTRISEDEIARVIGYARVKGGRPQRPRGRKATARRLALPSLRPLRVGAPRVAFA
jgi:hypothetical protein